MSDSGARLGRELCIHERRILAGDGSFTVQRSVQCSRRGGEAQILNCLFCERSEGIRDLGQGRRVLVCLDQPSAPTRHTSAPPHRPLPDETVSSLMTPVVMCVRPDVDVLAIVRLLVQHAISAVPVVDAHGKPLGVVSKTDLIRHLGDDELPSDEALDLGVHVDRLGLTTASDLMTPMVYSIPETAAIANAAALMAYEGVHRLPVLSTDGYVVGLISALDVLRWFAAREGFVIPPRDITARDEGDAS